MGESVWPLTKPPWEWEQVDVQELIDNKIPEDLHIEYKGSTLLAKIPQAEKENCTLKLTKEVSAFNNADGGVIVIGVVEGEEGGKNYPGDFDGGTDESQFSKTWLVQIISSNISPSISDLRVKPVKLSGECEGKVAYVVWVPKGTVAVQAKDLRYYQRVEDQSLPMRGFQVQDVNNRSIGPDLRLSFVLPQGQSNNNLTRAGGTEYKTPFPVAVVATNLSDTVAEFASFTIIVPDRLAPTKPTRFSEINLQPKINLHYKGRDISAYCQVFSSSYRTPDSPPIFKQLHPPEIGILDITLKDMYQIIPHYEPLLWLAEGPRMQPKSGSNIVITDGNTVEFKIDPEAIITLDDMDPLEYWKRQAPI